MSPNQGWPDLLQLCYSVMIYMKLNWHKKMIFWSKGTNFITPITFLRHVVKGVRNYHIMYYTTTTCWIWKYSGLWQTVQCSFFIAELRTCESPSRVNLHFAIYFVKIHCEELRQQFVGLEKSWRCHRTEKLKSFNISIFTHVKLLLSSLSTNLSPSLLYLWFHIGSVRWALSWCHISIAGFCRSASCYLFNTF